MSRRLSRTMLSAVFIVGGIDVLRNPGPRVKKSEKVAVGIASKIGLPEDPELLVRINAAVQVGAGAALAMGRFRRLAALALIASTIPTTYAGHRFWETDDPEERNQQLMHFLKNVGLVGGLVLTLVDKGGSPSLVRRAGRTAQQAGKVIALSTAAGGSKGAELSRRASRQAARAAATGAHVGLAAGGHALAATVHGTERTRRATRRMARHAARNAAHLASHGSHRAGEVFSVGSERAAGALSAGAHQASHAWNIGADRGGELLHAGARRASGAWNTGTSHFGN